MKRVVKGAEPQLFKDWKALASEDWRPRYCDLRDPEKGALHDALLAEQGGVCCYCGRCVSRADSHIEHFRPQEAYDSNALDYGNLHASCIRETLPGLPLHCGHAKGGVFDEKAIIEPTDPDCERRFIYPPDGSIASAVKEDDSAAYMIQLLKLDLAILRDRRADALGKVFDPVFLETMSREELMDVVSAYRAPDASGSMTDFGHVIARHAERLLELGF
jgi:uncharacterized protein (TIGR02646 family)